MNKLNQKLNAKLVTEDGLMTGIYSRQEQHIDAVMLDDILQSLTWPQKQLDHKYLYDSKGISLFDQICLTDEYYLCRCELELLPQVAKTLATKFKADLDLVEFGAGSLLKAKALLENVPQISHYYPVDIVADHLAHASKKLKQSFPHIDVTPLQADFTQKFKLPKLTSTLKLGFFAGSTIGNLSPNIALEFLNLVRRALGKGAYMLIGVDTKKSATVLHQAYNDNKGLTRAFNLNMLEHLNYKAGANFDGSQFEHYSFYNPTQSRIEMHLVSLAEQVVNIAEHNIYIAKGESIHTENAYKYTKQEFSHLVSKAGWQVAQTWFDANNQFAIYLLSTR